jgi:hypothetical protein
VALVRDLTAMKVRWFFNGEQVNEVNAAFTNAVAGNLPIILGNGWNRPFAGEIDEVRLWNRALSGAEIQAGRFSRAFGNEPGLVGAWSFEEASGTVIRDVSTNQNHGTMFAALPGRQPTRFRSGAPLGISPVIVTDNSAPVGITLSAVDVDGDALSYVVTALPASGQLFQTADGSTPGSLITNVPTVVSHPLGRVVFQPGSNFTGSAEFAFRANDGLIDSFPALATVNVLPAMASLVAENDSVTAFTGSSVIFGGLLTNDGAGATRLQLLRTPTNGTAVVNANGTVSYTPAPGFSGTDQFEYLVIDPNAWDRTLDYKPGVAMNSAENNPSLDRFGLRTWRMEFFRGEGLTNARPWFTQTPGLMVWDTSWFGTSGYWVFQDNYGSVAWADGMSHHLIDSGWAASAPGVAWISPLGNAAVDIAGRLEVEWTGNNGQGAPVGVDVAIARRSANGTVTPLRTWTVSKPTPAISAAERVPIIVGLTNIAVSVGDEIILTYRGQQALNDSRWVQLFDDLFIQRSAPGRTATVTVNVVSNAAPQLATALGSALAFDGVDDRVVVGNPPELQITGDQTIEFWIYPTNFAARRNPINKAYGGEGTMTIETDGRVNYFWGTGGGDGGSYQTFTTASPLKLNEWNHLALVRDLTARKLQWIINGRVNAEATTSYSNAVASPNSFVIGAGYAGVTAGSLDEVRVWNVARSLEQIQAAIYDRVPTNAPGLVGYWNFDEGTGTVAGSRGGLNGTLGGGNTNQLPKWVASRLPYAPPVLANEDTLTPFALNGTDADGDALTAIITELPENGRLFQTSDGVTPGPELVGDRALRFDGVDDLVTVTNALAADPTRMTNWTITAWIKPVAANNSFPVIFSKGQWTVSLGI